MSDSTFTQKCPNCQAAYRLGPAHQGKRVKCAKCGTQFKANANPLQPQAVPSEAHIEGQKSCCVAVYASLNERLAQAGICAAIFTVVSAGSSQIASGDVGPRLLALVSVGLSIWMKVQILCGAWDVGKYRKRCGNKLFQIYWGGSTAVIAIWAIGFVIAGRWDIIPTLIAAGLLPLIYFVLAGVPAALFAK